MGIVYQNSAKSFFKKAFYYITYFGTALFACFLALILVLNFLNPVLSEESKPQETQKEQLKLKKVFKDIVQNLKTVVKNSFSAQSSPSPQGEESGEVLKEPQEIKIPKEDLPGPDNSLSGTETAPKAPESIPTDSQGETAPKAPENIPPDSQGKTAPKAPESIPPDSQGETAPKAPESIPPDSQGETAPEKSLPVKNPTPPTPSRELIESAPTDPATEQSLSQISKTSPVEDPVKKDQPTFLPKNTPLNPSQNSSHPSENSSFENLPAPPDSEAGLEIQSYMIPFIYDSVQERDPFEDPTVKKDKGVVIIPKTPPEEYDLKEINLKGIIWDIKSPKALFKLPNNAGYYTLIKGDKIGKNGIIFEIRESEVIIVETSYIGSGNQKKEKQVVKIKKINRLADVQK